jgi:predicted ATP-grasp superfamily ATP-dependent carboligase
MAPAETVAVIAVSARALAQSAARSATDVIALDAFADLDTRAVATAVPVPRAGTAALDPVRAVAALAASAAGRRLAIVAGSGFERTPRLLRRLGRLGELYANPPDTVAALKDPCLSLEILGVLGWSTPETQRAAPPRRSGWLRKTAGGSGGIHVRRASGARTCARCYFQREVPGIPMSVTFLADAERAHVLGYNALLVEQVGDAPFCYAGVTTAASPHPALDAAIRHRLDRLVKVTALRGLNGIDFVLADGDAVALEINPRPTASFELYDEDYPEGLVHWHLRSFRAPLQGFDTGRASADRPCRGLRVVYAPRPLRVPPDVSYAPAWRDLPPGGTRIPAGAPVLTVFACASTAHGLRQELAHAVAVAQAQLASWAVGDTTH